MRPLERRSPSFRIRFAIALGVGCWFLAIASLVIRPHSEERSAAVSGTLLDARTRTPVAGADIFFTFDPTLHATSDGDGGFEIGATRYHHWLAWARSMNPPLFPQITITHTNWATQQLYWDRSPQTVLLQKLREPSEVRPWMTFDGDGTVLEDHGAVRYLAARTDQTPQGPIRGSIHFGSYIAGQTNHPAYISNGSLCVINVNFAQPVFSPQLTVWRGPNKPPLPATTAYGLSWSFWPRYEGPEGQIRAGDTSYVYKLEFIR